MCIKSYLAEADIAAHHIVKFGAADKNALTAAASTDLIIGVSDLAASTGEMVDVYHDDIAKVVLGGTVARGKKLTSDANGAAIEAAPAAGTNAFTCGFALESGVAGDLIDMFVLPGVIQG